MFYKCLAGSIILPFGITGVIIGAVKGYGNRGLWKAFRGWDTATLSDDYPFRFYPSKSTAVHWC